MRLLAIAFSLAALGGVLSGAEGSSGPAVLGWDYDARRLAYFGPATLDRVGARELPYNASLCSWSYSPDRRHLAISDCEQAVRFLAVPSLRTEGRITWGSRLGSIRGVAWLAPRRVVAVSSVGSDGSQLLTLDPVRRRVLERIDLGGTVVGRILAGSTAVVLSMPTDRFGPPTLFVTGPSGATRSILVERLSVGSVTNDGAGGTPSFDIRTPGFALDPVGRRAYVVGADLTTADVDLASGSVTYHGPVRGLQKAVSGWTRTARWLGGGMIGISGSDARPAVGGKDEQIETTPFGLRVLDTRAWTSTLVDAASSSLLARGRTMLAYDGGWAAYDRAGGRLYGIELGRRDWLSLAGARAYVCNGGAAVAVVALPTGARADLPAGRPCPTLLAGRASDD